MRGGERQTLISNFRIQGKMSLYHKASTSYLTSFTTGKTLSQILDKFFTNFSMSKNGQVDF